MSLGLLQYGAGTWTSLSKNARFPFPTTDLIFEWLGGYDDNNLVNVKGSNIPYVSGSDLDAIYDFSVLNDERLDKSNATYWTQPLPSWFYLNPSRPYDYKLKDFHYRYFENQMVNDKNFTFTKINYVDEVLISIDSLFIYNMELTENNLIRILNYIKFNINENHYDGEFSININYLELFCYNRNIINNTIIDNSLNDYNVTLLSGCFRGDNTGYYKCASTVNLGTDFTIEFYTDIKNIGNISAFIGNSANLNGRIYMSGNIIILRNNSTNVLFIGAITTTGVHKIKLKRTASTIYDLWIDDVHFEQKVVTGAIGDFIFDSIGRDDGTYLLQDDIWNIKVWDGSNNLVFNMPLENVTGNINYDVEGKRQFILISGSSANYGMQTTSNYISTYGCTKVVKSDFSEYEIIPYDIEGNPIYNHASPIWDSNETFTEHIQNGFNAIPGTYILLPEEPDLIASCATMVLQDWFDVSDNAIPILVENINAFEKNKQYFNINSFKDLIIIKLANQ